MPATILAVWVPVLLMESDPSTRRFALVVSLSLAGMAPTVVSAWLWWRYEASVAHST
ncbi:MAG: hypothetical protein H6721_15625 [Sandaracinus sp.]|nr:hypothetical protein [Sandaracinus sp.]MCB9618076.1 hypothetical protein [Sandaracinus sp.]MCB9624094.1 hypothetical protein [Sandaracinus sp.]MCB9633546.1 hypothetical protein [Sandaracinus sp.]